MASATDYLDAPSDELAPDYLDDEMSSLGDIRAGYINELQDPNVAQHLYSLTEREVGTQGPEARQAFLESVFNRAASRGQTLAQAVRDRGYYPGVSLRLARLSPERIGEYNELTTSVAEGSNLANYATGNASGNVGFAGGPQTYGAGGERYGIEKPDRGWYARSLEEVRRGKPVEEVIEPVEVRKGVPIKVREVEVRPAQRLSAEEYLDQEEPAPAAASSGATAPTNIYDQPIYDAQGNLLPPEQQGQGPPVTKTTKPPAPQMTAEEFLDQPEQAVQAQPTQPGGMRTRDEETELSDLLRRPDEVQTAQDWARIAELQSKQPFERSLLQKAAVGVSRALNLPVTRPPTGEEFVQALLPTPSQPLVGGQFIPREERTSEEIAKTAQIPASIVHPVIQKAAYNLVADTVNFFNSPEGAALTLATGGAAAARPAIGRLVTMGFGADAARNAINAAMQGNWADALESLGLAGIIGGGARAAAKAEFPVVRPVPRVQPGPEFRVEPEVTAAMARQAQVQARGILAPEEPRLVEPAAPPGFEFTGVRQPEPPVPLRTAAEIAMAEAPPAAPAPEARAPGAPVSIEAPLPAPRPEDGAALRAAAIARAEQARQEIENPEHGYHPDPEGALAQVDQQLKNDLAAIDARAANIGPVIEGGASPGAAVRPGAVEPAMSAAEFLDAPETVSAYRPKVMTPEEIADAGQKLRLKSKGQAGYAANLWPEVMDFGRNVYRSGMDFARWSAEMVRHLGERIRDQLQNIWDALVDLRGGRTLPQARERAAVGYTGGKRTQGGIVGEGPIAPIGERRGDLIHNAQGLWVPAGGMFRTPEGILVPNHPEMRISNRVPLSMKGVNPYENILANDLSQIMDNPDLARRAAAQVRETIPPSMRYRDPRGLLESAVRWYTRNQNRLGSLADAQEWGPRSENQYDGYSIRGHNIAKNLDFEFTPFEVLAAESRMSPRTPPDESFSATERLGWIMKNVGDFKWDKDMTRAAEQVKYDPDPRTHRAILERIKGRRYNDFGDDSLSKAYWAVTFDRAHNSPFYRVITPEGRLGDWARNKPAKGQEYGERTGITWPPFDNVARAINILERRSHFTDELQTPKIGSYYDSKAAPRARNNDVVIDTHATSASHYDSLGGSDPLIGRHLNLPGDKVVGNYGAYPLHVEAIIRAAANDPRKPLPKQFQAKGWSGQQMFLSSSALRGKATGLVNEVMRRFRSGKLTENEAIKKVNEIALQRHRGTIPKPAWAREPTGPHSEVYDGPGYTTKSGELPTGGGIREGAPGLGARARPPGRVPEVSRPLAERAKRLKSEARNRKGGYNTLIPDAIDFGRQLYTRGMDFARWSAEMVRHLGSRIREHLNDIWRSVTGQDVLPHARERMRIAGGAGVRMGERVPGAAPAREEPRAFAERFQEDRRIAQDIRDKTGNQTYVPISNQVTADQARDLVNARPITDVMNAIRDEQGNALPFHVRSAMGQQVIRRLNQTYENLKAAGNTRDANTVLNKAIEMAEWQQEYGTRLGQGVQSFAMWQRLTPEGKLVGIQRQVKRARDRYTADHQEEVAAIKSALSGDKTDAQKKAEFTKLMRSNATAKKVRNLTGKLIDAAKGGRLTDQTFYDVTAERLGLPKYDRESAAKIMDLALKVDKAPEGLPKDQATMELNRYIASKMGFKPSDLPVGVYYGNMLSGYNTHIVNAVDTLTNVMSELTGLALANPRAAGKIYGNALKGFKEGRADALLALTKGRQLQDTKWLDIPRLMEAARFGEKGGVPIVTKGPISRATKALAETKIAKPLNAWKYVTRLMAASDSIMFRGAKEGRAALLADRAAREEGLSGRGLDRRVQELLGRTEDQARQLRTQAEAEGFTGLAQVARSTELREKLRSAEANADATDFAGMATYNHEPQGILGHFSRGVERLFRSNAPGLNNLLPVMRAIIVPFTRIVANVTNRGLNYTPWGFKRAMMGYSGEAPPIGDARKAMVARATMGSAGLMTLMTLQGSGALQINGAGPSDPERRRQLQAAGWKPYSVKIGNKYWSYLPTPIGLGLSILGNMSDAYRYGELSNADALTRGAYALSRVGSTIFSQSFLQGLSNFFEALSSGPGETIANLRRTVSTTAGTATTPRIILDIQRIFDPRRFDSNTLGQDLMKNTPFAALTNKPTLNAFGEPVTMPSNRFVSPASKDLAWQIVTGRNLRVPVPDKYTKMPDGRGGERQITPEEYYDYLRQTGPKIKQYILTRQLLLRYMDPTKAQDDLSDYAQQIREPVLRRMRIHARYNPAN